MHGIPKIWKGFFFFFHLFVCFCFCFFVLFCFVLFCFFVFFFFVLFCFVFFLFLEVKTWKVKCYSLPFSLLPICNGKNLPRIEHTKRIKQGQDCQKVIARKSLRIYIYLFISHYCFFSFWSTRFLQSWKHVVQKYRIMKNVSPCLL